MGRLTNNGRLSHVYRRCGCHCRRRRCRQRDTRRGDAARLRKRMVKEGGVSLMLYLHTRQSVHRVKS